MEVAVEGQSATQLNDDNSETRINATSAGIAFGRAVSEGSRARDAMLGGNAFVGISVLDKTLINSFGDLALIGDNVGIMLAGDVWVRVIAAVTKGSLASYSTSTGQLNPASAGVTIDGSRYLTSAGAGQMALLRLTRAAEAAPDGVGNGAPDWVPTDAVIHIDLLGGTPQGRAWSNGAEVAIDTLLGSDPNTDNAWASTEYNSANINAYGYQPLDGQPKAVAFIGTARTMLLAGATVTVKEKLNAREGAPFTETINFLAVSTDGVDVIEIDAGYPVHGASGYSWEGDLNLVIPNILNDNANGVMNGVAFTFVPTRLDLAVNQSVAQTGIVDETMRPPGNPLVAALLNCNHEQAIQSITIYDPLPDTTGLSELSAV